MILLLRFLVIAVLIFYVIQRLKRLGASSRAPKVTKKDAYSILGVKPNASKMELKKAYKSALSEYHPDKVSHLGDDLKKLAQERTREIMNAYQSLT